MQGFEGKFSRNAFFQLAVAFHPPPLPFLQPSLVSFLYSYQPLFGQAVEERTAKRGRILIFLVRDGEIAITTSGAIETLIQYEKIFLVLFSLGPFSSSSIYVSIILPSSELKH